MIGVGFPPPRFDLGQGGEGGGAFGLDQVLEHEPFGGLGRFERETLGQAVVGQGEHGLAAVRPYSTLWAVARIALRRAEEKVYLMLQIKQR